MRKWAEPRGRKRGDGWSTVSFPKFYFIGCGWFRRTWTPTNEKTNYNKYKKLKTFPTLPPHAIGQQKSSRRLDGKMQTRNRNQCQEIMTNDSECEATFDPVSRRDRGGCAFVCVAEERGGSSHVNLPPIVANTEAGQCYSRQQRGGRWEAANGGCIFFSTGVNQNT